MNFVRFTRRSVPLAFALVTVAAYGLLLPLTGFYWDDWPFAWIARFLGPAEFFPAFRGFRPFLGPIFFLTTSLIPPDPLLWQIFALIIRFLAAISAWFALEQIWPQYRRQTLAVTFLLLVFPGYSQNWVAFTHINQEWIPFIFYLLSFGLTARALRVPDKALTNTVLSLIFLLIGILPTEYFLGLEPLRLFFIWLIVAETNQGYRSRLIRTLKTGWPYSLIWIVNLIWLVFFYKSGVYVSYDLTAVKTAFSLGETLLVIGDTLWKAGFYVWVQVLVLAIKTITNPSSLGTLALALLGFALLSIYLQRVDLTPLNRRAPNGDGPSDPDRVRHRNQNENIFARSAITIGLAGVVLGRLPSFAAALPLTLQSSFDRFMISMMLGASLLVAGMVELVVRRERNRLVVFAALIGLGLGQQFFNANLFRRDWQRQQEIYWQFAWRIPALTPDTTIFTHQMPLDYETDLSMTAALNWIYPQPLDRPRLPYALIYTEKRLGGSALPDLRGGTPVRLPFRTLGFSGNTSQSIAIYVPSNGCLRVFDPVYLDGETYSRFPDLLTAPIPLSKPDLILIDSEQPYLSDPPFISEPAHGWCYFYEKAELHRQLGDWEGIVGLGEKAIQAGVEPEDAFEWLPFIEAHARVGNVPQAERMTRQAWDEEPRLQGGLCVLWRRLQIGARDETKGAAQKMIAELNCTQ